MFWFQYVRAKELATHLPRLAVVHRVFSLDAGLDDSLFEAQ